MPVTISGNGSVTGLTDWEATSVTHPDSEDTNITLSDDGSVVFDSIPAAIQSAIDAVPVPAGIGSNVVTATSDVTFTTSSATYVDVTDLSVTITPTSATSKVLVIATINHDTFSGARRKSAYRLVRGATELYETTEGSGNDSSNGPQGSSASLSILDSPATTSATTYKIEGKNISGTSLRAESRTITAIEVAA